MIIERWEYHKEKLLGILNHIDEETNPAYEYVEMIITDFIEEVEKTK